MLTFFVLIIKPDGGPIASDDICRRAARQLQMKTLLLALWVDQSPGERIDALAGIIDQDATAEAQKGRPGCRRPIWATEGKSAPLKQLG
jgi:hypothetical protein